MFFMSPAAMTQVKTINWFWQIILTFYFDHFKTHTLDVSFKQGAVAVNKTSTQSFWKVTQEPFIVYACYLENILSSSCHKAVIAGSVLYCTVLYCTVLQALYWAIITMTSVGYGDISPTTWFGKLVGSGELSVVSGSDIHTYNWRSG